MTDFEVHPINKVKDLEAKLEKAREVLRYYAYFNHEAPIGHRARTCLKEIEDK